uniref:Uncharacterized protein n=1 Tax=Rhizophora mucronata TaxID=61149 RepID=A0A2P2QC94_RHIMU
MIYFIGRLRVVESSENKQKQNVVSVNDAEYSKYS